MNKSRRHELASVLETLEELRAALKGLLEEEEEYRDNIPENFQGSERYAKAEAACEALSEAVYNLETAADLIQEAIQ